MEIDGAGSPVRSLESGYAFCSIRGVIVGHGGPKSDDSRSGCWRGPDAICPTSGPANHCASRLDFRPSELRRCGVAGGGSPCGRAIAVSPLRGPGDLLGPHVGRHGLSGPRVGLRRGRNHHAQGADDRAMGQSLRERLSSIRTAGHQPGWRWRWAGRGATHNTVGLRSESWTECPETATVWSQRSSNLDAHREWHLRYRSPYDRARIPRVGGKAIRICRSAPLVSKRGAEYRPQVS
jgi:hypothetical protein